MRPGSTVIPRNTGKAKRPSSSQPIVASPVPAVARPVTEHPLKFTNLKKILFPSTRFTKGDLLEYYHRVAPLILPHLRGRAVTLKRYPSGFAGKGFFNKHCPLRHPSWLRTEVVHSSSDAIEYLLIEELASLLWTANLNTIELHVPLALAATPMTPKAIMFDLAPAHRREWSKRRGWHCGSRRCWRV